MSEHRRIRTKEQKARRRALHLIRYHLVYKFRRRPLTEEERARANARQRARYWADPDKARERGRRRKRPARAKTPRTLAYERRKRAELATSYVKKRLRADGFSGSIPAPLVDLKRAHLKLTRSLKGKK